MLGADDKIPTEAALCERYDVSRTVVRQALSDLERTGLVTRLKGRGTFVAAPKLSEFVAQTLTSLHEDLSARGERLETTVLRLEVEPVSPHVARMLDLPESEQIVLLERLRYLRGEPLVVTTAYMPYALCAPILELDMSDRSLFETYERELGLQAAPRHAGDRGACGEYGDRRASRRPRGGAGPRLQRRHLHRGRPPDRVLRRHPPRRPEPLRDRALPAVGAGRGARPRAHEHVAT